MDGWTDGRTNRPAWRALQLLPWHPRVSSLNSRSVRKCVHETMHASMHSILHACAHACPLHACTRERPYVCAAVVHSFAHARGFGHVRVHKHTRMHVRACSSFCFDCSFFCFNCSCTRFSLATRSVLPYVCMSVCMPTCAQRGAAKHARTCSSAASSAAFSLNRSSSSAIRA